MGLNISCEECKNWKRKYQELEGVIQVKKRKINQLESWTKVVEQEKEGFKKLCLERDHKIEQLDQEREGFKELCLEKDNEIKQLDQEREWFKGLCLEKDNEIKQKERIIDQLETKMSGIDDWVLCSLCLEFDPLRVQWKTCGHSFCYDCVFSFFDQLPDLFTLDVDSHGELICIFNRKKVSCPGCKQHPIIWHRALDSQIGVSSTPLSLPSPDFVRMLGWLSGKDEQDYKCPFCDKRDALLPTLVHCHECRKRSLTCPFCKEARKVFFERDEFGHIAIDINKLKLHLESECGGRWFCCNEHVAARDIESHLKKHILRNYWYPK